MAFGLVLGVFGKLSTRREVHGLSFHGVWTCDAKVPSILNEFFY
jgi:hypothetical protein